MAACLVTYGDRVQLLEPVMRALSGVVHMIVVVANGCSPDTVTAIERLGDEVSTPVELIRLGVNAGSAGGFHAGISNLLGRDGWDFAWLLDDDNLPDDATLPTLLAHWHALAEMGPGGKDTAVTCLRPSRPGLTAPLAGRPIHRPSSCLGFSVQSLLRRLLLWRAAGPAALKIAEVPFAPYGGLLIPRQLVERTGPPRREFVLYADDTEFTLRMRQRAGARIFVVAGARISDIEESGLGHVGPRLFSQRAWLRTSRVRAYYAVRNQVYLERRMLPGGGVAYAANAAALAMALLITATVYGRWRNLPVLFRAFVDGATGRLGEPARFGLSGLERAGQ